MLIRVASGGSGFSNLRLEDAATGVAGALIGCSMCPMVSVDGGGCGGDGGGGCWSIGRIICLTAKRGAVSAAATANNCCSPLLILGGLLREAGLLGLSLVADTTDRCGV